MVELNRKIAGLDLPIVARILLSNNGPVQDMLGIIFETEVRVEVLSQTEFNGSIIRWVKLVGCRNGIEETYCLAESIIPIANNTQGFLTGIHEKKWGIGKIIDSTGMTTTRKIVGVYSDENVFARNYIIENVAGERDPPNYGIKVLITETFPKQIFNGLS